MASTKEKRIAKWGAWPVRTVPRGDLTEGVMSELSPEGDVESEADWSRQRDRQVQGPWGGRAQDMRAEARGGGRSPRTPRATARTWAFTE